ncbi:hypothetical protein E1161_13285 [Saccharopolyspora aridisoli]|uniref:Uncharacterized protein n=1 Tax=Saccharopolyspora aridisoli TaxID=2530385 RepID=A0A4R4USJ6_9PSEU|nr:hypothetical protein [Saccharopolyspora aridisoli]TDC92342.1 hypothetical protein E1161_13285 [Saccharopolyspora aridisoli]
MTLRIWETDPDSKPRPRNRYVEDVVGYIHGGMMIKTKPVSLSEWRFTTDDPEVAARIAELYGGEVEEWDTERANNQQVLSETSRIELVIDDPDALRSRMVLWGRKGIIHACDGLYFVDGEDRGQPCGCPPEFSVRKANAEKGTGPQPEITLKARLAADEKLGFFLYRTSSWTLTKELHEIEAAIAEAGGEGSRVRLTLSLEHVEFTTKKGQHVDYHRPALTDITTDTTSLEAAA